MNTALETKLTAILRHILLIEDDVALAADAELVQQIGLDSIEAFDAVATMHEIIGQPIPTDFNPKVSNSIRRLAQYIEQQFGEPGVQRILEVDVNTIAQAAADEEL